MKDIAIILVILGVLGLFIFTGPKEQKPEFNNPKTQYTTVIKILNTMEDVDKEYKKVWKLQKNPVIEFEKGERYGFSYVSSEVCFVVIAREDRYTLKELERTLGHEHLHCMYGAWHD